MSSLDEAIRSMIAEAVERGLDARLPRGAVHPQSDYLSVADAARLAAVSSGTIRHWLATGRLKTFRAGRELRVRRDDLERFLAQGASSGQRSDGSPEAAAERALRARRRRAKVPQGGE